jgi:hypothetical protein
MFHTNVVQEIKTHVLCSIIFCSKIRAVYEIVWKNTVGRVRPQMTIWRMRIACCITKPTHTHTKYAILIVFPLPQ